jgi:hypothetical protein
VSISARFGAVAMKVVGVLLLGMGDSGILVVQDLEVAFAFTDD